MDEFRKEYEYEDEKISGFLLIFVMWLASLDLFLSIMLIVRGVVISSKTPVFGQFFLVFGILFIGLLITTGIMCYKTMKNFVNIAKIFLIVRLVFAALCLSVVYIYTINDTNLIGIGTGQYKSIFEMTMVVLVYPAAYYVLFSVLWFLYFLKSKKCALLA